VTGRRAGFTLLEVMIAVVILAVGLSSLFTAEAGAVRLGQRARTTTIASLLARCKMGEIEEEVAKKGWPSSTLEERDECCEDAEHKGFSCEWKVERIKLPDVEEKEGEGSEEGEQGGDEAPGKPPNVLDKLASLKSDSKDPMAAVSELMMSGSDDESDSDDESASATDPIGALLMELTFPIMKPVIEEGVRRASVKVKWSEGQREQSMEIVQFLVSEQQIILPDDENADPNAQPGAGGTTPSTSGTQSTTTPSTSSTPSTSNTAGGRR
jgi:general secretion pathway protein I